jgi:hypothetical protein
MWVGLYRISGAQGVGTHYFVIETPSKAYKEGYELLSTSFRNPGIVSDPSTTFGELPDAAANEG